MQLPSQPICWSKRSFLTVPLFRSRLRQRFYAIIYQKTSGIHFIRRLLYFVSTIPTEVIFFLLCVLAGNKSASIGGQRASWLIRILQREKSRALLRFGDWVWNTGWRGPRFQPKIYTLKNLLTPARAQSLIFAGFEGSSSQGCKTAVCRWVIAPGPRIQPRNCTVRIWRLARLNSADVTASSLYGRTEFDRFLAIKCLISSSYQSTNGHFSNLFSAGLFCQTIFEIYNMSFFFYPFGQMLSPLLHV